MKWMWTILILKKKCLNKKKRIKETSSEQLTCESTMHNHVGGYVSSFFNILNNRIQEEKTVIIRQPGSLYNGRVTRVLRKKTLRWVQEKDNKNDPFCVQNETGEEGIGAGCEKFKNLDRENDETGKGFLQKDEQTFPTLRQKKPVQCSLL